MVLGFLAIVRNANVDPAFGQGHCSGNSNRYAFVRRPEQQVEFHPGLQYGLGVGRAKFRIGPATGDRSEVEKVRADASGIQGKTPEFQDVLLNQNSMNRFLSVTTSYLRPAQPAEAAAIARFLFCQINQLGKFRLCKRRGFSRALQFDESVTQADHIHVCFGIGILSIIQIEHRRAAIDTNADGRNKPHQRILRWNTVDGIRQSQCSAGDRCGTSTTIGLNHITVDANRALAQFLHIDHGAQ